MNAETVDAFALLAPALGVAVVAAALIRSRPRLALAAFLVAVGFVPYWLGASAFFYFAPATAVAVLALVSLAGLTSLRLGLVDLVLVFAYGLAISLWSVGLASRGDVADFVLEGGSAYFLARVLVTMLGPDLVYVYVARMAVAVSVLALLEALLHRNVFTEFLARGNSFYRTWGTLQERGGAVRVEGAFGHSIALGVSLALCVPLVLACHASVRFKVVGLAAIVAAATLTLSRLGLVCSVLAAVLSLLVLSDRVQARARTLVTVGLVGGAAVVLPFFTSVFSEAGTEASGSADYRGDLLELLPAMRLIGVSDELVRTADGRTYFGAYRSIDSAFILLGLRFGAMMLLLLLALLVAAVVAALVRPANPAAIAIVAVIPALTSVAFITQYNALFWFVAGVAATVGISRPWSEGRPAKLADSVPVFSTRGESA